MAVNEAELLACWLLACLAACLNARLTARLSAATSNEISLLICSNKKRRKNAAPSGAIVRAKGGRHGYGSDAGVGFRFSSLCWLQLKFLIHIAELGVFRSGEVVDIK